MLNMAALFVFPALMAFAAFSDLFTMRISNRLVALVALGFLGAALLVGLGWAAFGWHLAVGVGVLAVAFAFFSMGWIGGGDAKFAAATALWIGPGLIGAYLAYSAILGGALTLGILLARRLPLPAPLAKVAWIERLHDAGTGIPYGIALAAGALLVYSQTTVFHRFVA